MYIPKAFHVDDVNELMTFIRNHSFGIMVSQTEEEPFATHLPFLLDEQKGENGVLISHLARANPHWQGLQDQKVLVVFQGPHAYISPTWYDEPRTVPTWNYVAVHVYGTFRQIQDKHKVKEWIEKTVNVYEQTMNPPWEAVFDEPFMEGLLNGIVAFEIEVERMEGKWKLNQNHPIERQERVVKKLKSINEPNAQKMAELMEKEIEKRNK
ncbi:FMN-binding negative transcriptional regulator [Halalkalibacterium halodurans]|uniref:FMN-binding negative transcriptional regulator n=1 Tax=Halalkalibacterium halodurans TaxID=86665 RepID=UPI002AA9908A|nr:FMN-binding negative transcriptional regulator [Halalkalibacterium halodurans]MDY7220905.1 FMN-binding negative transcriptional regulator [Halalkalibacterium halodurans]MDY7240144.1 FMN-binding negative transcriptional regulator [Halalkalibacterium halodurans]MED4082539.1 FMN-binding negative transcriptional regulator [Halalkalibacterium halodurans]MED4085784.1 FMN-binding negative transcriptional regulator [Halalkalibacterium halodurans]MED4105650.1 FMN-binding negative transcriptional reg